MKKYSISQLAAEFGLTRSALLHYDATGILKPAARSGAGYRVYTEREYERLRRINSLRGTGISLEQIRQILDSENNRSLSEILHERIEHISSEIKSLREQQNIIIKLVGNEELLKKAGIVTKEMWVAILSSSGLDEEGMTRWHREFESSAPEAHHDFLQSLGLPDEEIREIRAWSKKTAP